MWNKILSLFKKDESQSSLNSIEIKKSRDPKPTPIAQKTANESFTVIQMLKLSSEAKYYKISKWLVTNNQVVKEGDILAEIETDKAFMEFESLKSGRIEIIAKEGINTNTGDVIAKIHHI